MTAAKWTSRAGLLRPRRFWKRLETQKLSGIPTLPASASGWNWPLTEVITSAALRLRHICSRSQGYNSQRYCTKTSPILIERYFDHFVPFNDSGYQTRPQRKKLSHFLPGCFPLKNSMCTYSLPKLSPASFSLCLLPLLPSQLVRGASAEQKDSFDLLRECSRYRCFFCRVVLKKQMTNMHDPIFQPPLLGFDAWWLHRCVDPKSIEK